jgi:hypothetical protein
MAEKSLGQGLRYLAAGGNLILPRAGGKERE